MKKLTFLIILLCLSIFDNSYAELTVGKFTNNPDVDAFVNKMNTKIGSVKKVGSSSMIGTTKRTKRK